MAPSLRDKTGNSDRKTYVTPRLNVLGDVSNLTGWVGGPWGEFFGGDSPDGGWNPFSGGKYCHESSLS